MTECEECGIGFGNYWRYKEHMDEEHNGIDRPDDAKKYECDFCDEEYYAPFKLMGHYASEHDVEEMYWHSGGDDVVHD